MDERTIPGLAWAVAELSRLILGEGDLHDGLEQLAKRARETVPGCDNASVTLILQGKPTTAAVNGR